MKKDMNDIDEREPELGVMINYNQAIGIVVSITNDCSSREVALVNFLSIIFKLEKKQVRSDIKQFRQDIWYQP